VAKSKPSSLFEARSVEQMRISLSAEAKVTPYFDVTPMSVRIDLLFLDSKVYIWRTNGHLVEALDAHHGCVNAVAWHPKDPRVFASAGDDHKVRMYEISNFPYTVLAPSHLTRRQMETFPSNDPEFERVRRPIAFRCE